MQYRTRTYYGAEQKNLMWDRWQAPTPREIPLRSNSVNASFDRRFSGGRIPPVLAKMPCIAEW